VTGSGGTYESCRRVFLHACIIHISGGFRNFWKGAQDNASAASSFIATAHDELCALCTGKDQYWNNSEANRGRPHPLWIRHWFKYSVKPATTLLNFSILILVTRVAHPIIELFSARNVPGAVRRERRKTDNVIRTNAWLRPVDYSVLCDVQFGPCAKLYFTF